MVGKYQSAPLRHVAEQSRGVLHAGEVDHVLGELAFHEGVLVKVLVGHHAGPDRVEVLEGAFHVPFSQGTVNRCTGAVADSGGGSGGREARSRKIV